MSEEKEQVVAEGAAEKRNHIRFRIDMSVYVRLSNGDLVRTQGKDISRSGVYIEYEASADVDDEFEMIFDVPLVDEMPRIYVRVRVMRSTLIGGKDVYGVAFQFLHFSNGSEALLDKYLELRETKQRSIF
jgi:hypothetical protein